MEVKITIGLDPALSRLLTMVSAELAEKIMASLDDIKAKVAEQKTLIGSLTTFVQGLESQISAIPGLTAEQQAAIDQIFQDVSDNDAAITAAMATNTPAAPVTPGASTDPTNSPSA